MILKHVIITRFSVPNLWESKLDNDDEYLKYRLRLFCQFCLPSIKSQLSQEFVWLVLFGKDTPNWFRAHISKWESDKIMIPIYVSNWVDATQKIKNWIYNNSRSVDFIVTTRLDSDDSLASNFVIKIKECIPEALQQFEKWKTQKGAKYYYIDPIQGHQVDRRSDDPRKWRFYVYRYEANPFMSMIEPFNDEILTVFWKRHTDLVASPKSVVIQIDGIMWMQVIHDNNYANRLLFGHKQEQAISPDLNAFPWLSKYLPIICGQIK